MKCSVVIFLTLTCFQLSFAGNGGVECLPYLKKKSERPKDQQEKFSRIARDLSLEDRGPVRFSIGQVANPSDWITVPIFHDFALADSGMLTLEPIEQQAKLDLEIQTARDYAKFLSRTSLKRFVYTSEFANMSVPIFDGVVIDAPTGIPDVNVSLKYASIRMKKEDIDTLLESLDGRLNYDWEFAHLDHPAEWFRKFVGPVSYSGHGKNGKSILYQHHIKVTEMLIKIFDLFQDAESDVFSKRELRTVLDMRDHGYSFDFVRKPEVLERVSKIVEAKQQQNQSLTLLWDDRRVIEFTPQEVRISDTNF